MSRACRRSSSPSIRGIFRSVTTTPVEFIISVVAGLLAPLLAIFLIVQLVLGIQAGHKPDTSSEAAQKATLARIKPVAQLAALDANAPRVEKSGQEVYDAVCTSCHAAGALGAPKFENKGDWGSRIGMTIVSGRWEEPSHVSVSWNGSPAK